MKVAVIGSRGLVVKNLGKYLPPNTSEIVSDGASHGTKFVIDKCVSKNKPLRVIKQNEKAAVF